MGAWVLPALVVLAIWTAAAVELPVEAVVTSDGDIPLPVLSLAGLPTDALAPDVAPGGIGQRTAQRCEHCGLEFVPVPRPTWQHLTDTGRFRGTLPVTHAAADGLLTPPGGGAPRARDDARAAAAPGGDASHRNTAPQAASGCDLSSGSPACLIGAQAGPPAVSHDAAHACACGDRGNGHAVGAAATMSHALTAGRSGDTLGLWKSWRAYAGDGKNDREALIEHARGAVRPLEALAALSAVAGSLVRHRNGTEALRTLVQRAPMLRPRHASRRCPVCAALATLAGDAWRAPDHGPRQPARGDAGLTH